jgi:hypothetical protein
MWDKWPSTTPQPSTQPPSKLNLLFGAQEELEQARTHGLAESERLLRQDRQPIWASSQKFQDVRKRRLKLSQQFAEAGRLVKRLKLEHRRRCRINWAAKC